MSTQNIIDSKELYSQYSWYRNTFSPAVQKACDEFFLPGFEFCMIGISKNINPLSDKSAYFVTKIRIDKQYDMFFRSSEDAISLILEKTLGKTNRTFNLNKITDLEAKIITAYNDYVFGILKEFLSSPPAGELRRSNFDVIHLTFIVKDAENNKFGKFVVTIPDALLQPESIVCKGEKFNHANFAKSTLDVKLKVGSTRFSVHDLKNLDTEDMVIFDNSNTKKMVLVIDDYEKEVKLNPNLGLITPIEESYGGENMGANNLWDSIEVEMNAEFDAVKITLGELKQIEDGNVVDLTSIYNNRVTLKVEDKVIAKGELVIVNDRYGVKINEVLAQKPAITEQETVAEEDNTETTPAPETNTQSESVQDSAEDEFDYSDFELDDDI